MPYLTSPEADCVFNPVSDNVSVAVVESGSLNSLSSSVPTVVELTIW
jgi:hypothetical protein